MGDPPPSLRPLSLSCFSSLLMAQVPVNAESSMTPGHGFGAFWRLCGQKMNRPPQTAFISLRSCFGGCCNLVSCLCDN